MLVNDEWYRYVLGNKINGKDRFIAAGNKYEHIKAMFNIEVEEAINNYEYNRIEVYIYDSEKDTNIDYYDSAIDRD